MNIKKVKVLILVLMEDTLRDATFDYEIEYEVLILVLMEDTLRGQNYDTMDELFAGLNPCFNGRYSQRVEDPKNLLRLRMS